MSQQGRLVWPECGLTPPVPDCRRNRLIGPHHNQTLSEDRATAVLDYLVVRGIAKDRMVSKGFSSSVPADSNRTAAGRATNRRVEFVVDFIILKEGSTQ